MNIEQCEVWKDIPNYEGLYQVSNYGRIKRVLFKNGKYEFKKEKILKLRYDKDGYEKVTLYKNGTAKIKSIHRLVAEAFVSNPNNYSLVLHKKSISDGGNNNENNLYWGTQKMNMQDKKRDGHNVIIKYWLGKKGKEHPLSKKIDQYDLKGNFIKTWDCMNDIQRELKINSSNVHSVCNKKRNKAGGFIWKYSEV